MRPANATIGAFANAPSCGDPERATASLPNGVRAIVGAG
jgi:hypothetical protein